jgi:plastocyanin
MSRAAAARRVGAWGLIAALLASAAPAPAGAALVIVIEQAALRPRVLATVVGQRVAFVNRSGRLAHVEFLPGHGDGHRVFQVPGEIWAVFNRPGRHHYVIHFSTRREGDLRGAVEVTADPGGGQAVPVCTGLSVMGECLEP